MSIYDKCNIFYKMAIGKLSPEEAYQILGIDASTPKDSVKKKFRQLTFQYHPDFNKEPDANAKFREIKDAYELAFKLAPHSSSGERGKGVPINGSIEILIRTFDLDSLDNEEERVYVNTKDEAKDKIENLIGEFFDFQHGPQRNVGDNFNIAESALIGSGGDLKICLRGATWRDVFPEKGFYKTEAELDREYEEDQYWKQVFHNMCARNPGMFHDEVAEIVDEMRTADKQSRNPVSPEGLRLSQVSGLPKDISEDRFKIRRHIENEERRKYCAKCNGSDHNCEHDICDVCQRGFNSLNKLMPSQNCEHVFLPF